MKAENNEDDLEDVPFEPKLTRSKAKELREKQHMVRFPISKFLSFSSSMFYCI